MFKLSVHRIIQLYVAYLRLWPFNTFAIYISYCVTWPHRHWSDIFKSFFFSNKYNFNNIQCITTMTPNRKLTISKMLCCLIWNQPIIIYFGKINFFLQILKHQNTRLFDCKWLQKLCTIRTVTKLLIHNWIKIYNSLFMFSSSI